MKARPQRAINKRLRKIFEAVDEAERVDYDLADGFDRPQTACVWQAGWDIEVIVGFLAFGWRVPEDLVERWYLYHAGYWPCANSVGTGDVSPNPYMGQERS